MRSEVSRKRIFAGRELFFFLLPASPSRRSGHVWSGAISWRQGRFFTWGAWLLCGSRLESVHIKGSQERLCLFLFQMEPLWNYREDNDFPSR